MGNSNKKAEDYEVVRSFKPEEWLNKEKRPNCEIWQNTSKNVRADVYPIKSDIKPVDLDHYEMRYNNSQDIVKVHNLHINQETGLCSKPSDAHVYVERIPLRLNNVQDLTQPEALSVLRSCYSGFNTISTFYGPVEPYEDLICFNEQGHTKVWVNSNLAVNNPAKESQGNKVGNLANVNVAYVNKILDLVQNRTSNGSFPARLKNKFRQNNPKTYFEALNLVEEYAAQERIQIPNNINLRWGDVSSNRSQLQNTVSKVTSYNNGTQPSSGSFYQSTSNFREAQYLPMDQSRYIANANNPSIVRVPTHQNLPFISPAQPADFTKFRSQSSVSFRQPAYFTDPNPRVPNVNFGSRIVGPVSPRVNYAMPLSIPATSVSPRNIPIPIQNTPLVKFQSPSKVITHQIVRPFAPNNAPVSIKIESPLKSTPASPAKKAQEIVNENVNEVSIQSQRSQMKNVQKIQTKIQTPRINVVNTNQENKVVINQINQGPTKLVINAQPNYQQFAVRPQGVVSLHPATTVRPPPQAAFSFPVYNDANRIQVGQQMRKPVLVVQPPVPVQQVVNPPQPQQLQQVPPQTEIIQQVTNKAQEKTQVVVVEQTKNTQNVPQVPNVVPAQVHSEEKLLNQQRDNELEGYEEGYEEDEMERQLQQLQPQHFFQPPQDKTEDQHQNQHQQQSEEQQKYEEAEEQADTYFPFAGQALKQKGEQLRRVETTELKQEEFQQLQNQERAQYQFENFKNQSDVRVPLGEQEQETEKQIVRAPDNKYQHVQQHQEGVQTSYDRDYSAGYQYTYKSSIPQATVPDRIPDDARYEDIEQYIRNKYQTYIGVNETPSYRENSTVTPYTAEVKKVEQGEMYSYVESKYDQYSNQDMQFSFRPTPEQAQPREEKPSLISSYEYMRVQQMYGEPQISVERVEEPKPEPRKQSQPTPVVEVKKFEKEDHEDDILDVKNMERSLDKKYSSMRSNQQIKDLDSIKRDEKQDNQFDVKKLEQNLMRFDQSINHTSNISEPRFETSQVSKINSIEEKLGNRRSSMNRDFNYKDQTYEIKSYSYENQSPVYEFGKKSRASKISKEISDIDEKFSKYVKMGNAISSSSSKAALKPKEDNYGYREYDYDSSSRMATGHFGYTDYSKGEDKNKNYKEYNREKATFVTSDVKSPSYEDLRKYMWS